MQMPDPLLGLQEQLEREATGLEKPLASPWTRLNHALGGGFRPGTFSLLVGEPGSAKTYIALAICLFAHNQKWGWKYWPFERDDAYAARRMLAVLLNRWSVLEPEESPKNRTIMDDTGIFNQMARVTQYIEANPRQLRKDADDNYYIPSCTYRSVFDQLWNVCKDTALVVLDPLSMLYFDGDGRDEWKGQENFAKDASAMVAQTGSRLLAVHHTRKSMPGMKSRLSSLDEVAGAAALSRFADNVIFLEHNPDGQESDVITPDGIHSLQMHRRTLYIAKARDGRGTGWRIACDLDEQGPNLIEYGYIQKKGNK